MAMSLSGDQNNNVTITDFLVSRWRTYRQGKFLSVKARKTHVPSIVLLNISLTHQRGELKLAVSIIFLPASSIDIKTLALGAFCIEHLLCVYGHLISDGCNNVYVLWTLTLKMRLVFVFLWISVIRLKNFS